MSSNLVYYVLDTETVGLSVDKHEINQISIMRVEDEAQLNFQIKLKNPNIYDYRALEVQGTSPEELKVGTPLEEVADKIDAFMAEDGKTKGHRCIIAHNAPFDRKFVHKAWDSVNKEFQADLWLCTQSFSKRYVKLHGTSKFAQAQVNGGVELKKDKKNQLKPKFGLNNVLIGAGLPIKEGAHSAEVDVQNTVVLYNWLKNSKTEHVSLIGRVPHKEIKPQDLDIDDF